MKIQLFIVLIWTELLLAKCSRSLESLSGYLESHDLAGVGNTKQCFANYLPELEQVGATWSRGYNSCLQQATTGRGTVLTKLGGMQQIIRKAALGIGNYLETCLNITDILDFFECFAKLSKQQLSSMYTISFNASEGALTLTQQFNGIDAERYLCTNRTEESYVLGTAHIFDELDKCLQLAAADAVKTTD